MTKTIGTKEREKSWHQEMDEHLSAGGDLDTPPGGGKKINQSALKGGDIITLGRTRILVRFE